MANTNTIIETNITSESDTLNTVEKQRPRKPRAAKVDGAPAGNKARKTNANEIAPEADVPKKPASETKASIVLKKLTSARGVTVNAMMEATGWQAHSVRGFLSAVVRKKLGHNLNSETGKDGVRRYRIQADGKSG